MKKITFLFFLLLTTSVAFSQETPAISKRYTTAINDTLLDSFIKKKKFDNALFVVNNRLKEEPDKRDLLFKKATIHLDINQDSIAISVLERLLSLYPQDTESKIVLGNILYVKGYKGMAILQRQFTNINQPNLEEVEKYFTTSKIITDRCFKTAYNYLAEAQKSQPSIRLTKSIQNLKEILQKQEKYNFLDFYK